MQPAILRPQPDEEYYFKEGCHILEISNDKEDPDGSIARARVAPGVTTRLHRLCGITERYLILEGQGEVRVGGQPPEMVQAGDVVRIPPGCSQQICNTGHGDLIFLAICTPRFVPEAYEEVPS